MDLYMIYEKKTVKIKCKLHRQNMSRQETR